MSTYACWQVLRHQDVGEFAPDGDTLYQHWAKSIGLHIADIVYRLDDNGVTKLVGDVTGDYRPVPVKNKVKRPQHIINYELDGDKALYDALARGEMWKKDS